MRALVIGASGHIGNAVVRALLDRKYEVTACGRRSTPPVNLAGLPVRYSPGDADEARQLERWIAGHDIVIDAAGPYPVSAFLLTSQAVQDPIAHAERRTRWLIEALYKHDARLAYISSFVTLARPRTRAQRLQAQMMRLVHPYFEVKELIESQIVDAARRGLHAVIVNPTYCLGPWDLRDPRRCLIPVLLRGEVPASFDQMLDAVDVRDVAAGLIAATEAGRYAEPIMLRGHEISTRQLYSSVCEIAGVAPPRISTSTGLAFAGAYWMEVMLGMMGQETPVPSAAIMLTAAFDFLIPSNRLQELGITPRPLRETLTDAITWYRQIGYC